MGCKCPYIVKGVWKNSCKIHRQTVGNFPIIVERSFSVIANKGITKVIQSLYEDKVLGKISEERFILMSEAYEQEQFALKETIANRKCEIERYEEINDNINNFVSIVVKAERINKLTPEIVRLLIEKLLFSKR